MRIYLHRRDFVRTLSGAAFGSLVPGLTSLSGLTSGCKTHRGTSQVLDNDNPAANGFLSTFGPLTLASARPAGEWLGDEMNFGHQMIRDTSAPDSIPGTPERTSLVIIGGGMSGLGAGYLLRDRKPVFLEINRNFGGNSRGERWNRTSYSIGAAYLVPPGDDHALTQHFYGPLKVSADWRLATEGKVILNEKLHDGFWEGKATESATEKTQLARLQEYLKTVAAESLPEIPPVGSDVTAAVKALDRENFLDHLVSKVGTLEPGVRAYLEHYCWSSFGTDAARISAAAGLNFLAGETDGIAVMPGGNAEVARRLMGAIMASGLPEENFRTQVAVRSVRKVNDLVQVVYTSADGTHRAILADRVIIACPKFLARYFVQDLPAVQAKAIRKLSYSSYVVANAILNQPLAPDQYDVYMLGDLNETFESIQESSDTQGITDVILGHWAQSAQASTGASDASPDTSVLTLYRALPFASGRARLHADDSHARFTTEITTQMRSILKAFSLSPNAVQELRLARFGHALVNASPGLLANGTARAACKPIGNRIFFCNQDNWALPCIESALGAAIATAQQIKDM